MSVSTIPFVKPHWHDDNGSPASGYKLYSWIAGSDTPQPLYKDVSGLAEHPNPLTLNSRGEPDGDGVFLEDGVSYKLALKRDDGSTAWSAPLVTGGEGGSGGYSPLVLPGRTLLGNASSSTAEAGAVPLESALSNNFNAVPSSAAVVAAIDTATDAVLGNSGAQALDGSLTVSGSVSAATVEIAGQNADERYVRADGLGAMTLLGNPTVNAGPAAEVPMVSEITESTDGGAVPTVEAVRGLVDDLEQGLVKSSFSDTPGYLAEKLAGSDSVDVSLENGSTIRLRVSASLLAELDDSIGVVKVTQTGDTGYLEDRVIAGTGVEVSNDGNNLTVKNTAPETFKAQAHSASTLQGFLSSLVTAGTGINIGLTPDMNSLVLTATGSAVGGFYWKGTWTDQGTYNSNNAVWYFDHTGEIPISRLYIAVAPNQGINPYTDAGIGTGTAWSCMMAVDYMGDQFVMLDGTDLESGFLADKLKAGTAVTLTRGQTGNSAHYTIDLDATLVALAALDSSAGFLAQTGADTFAKRSLVGGTGTSVTNGSGAAGNPSVNVAFEAAPANIKMNGTQAVGTLNTSARGDHVHPVDTSREPAVTAGTVSQFWSGLKTWRDLAADVRAVVLTGLSTATNSAITATDSILVSLGKLQAQINARPAISVVDAVTDGSMSAVTSNGVFDALATKAPLPVSITAHTEGDPHYSDGGIFYSFARSVPYWNVHSVLNITVAGGTTVSDQYAAKVSFNLKCKGGAVTMAFTVLEGFNYEGKLKWRYDASATDYFYTLSIYIPSYATLDVLVEDGVTPSNFTNAIALTNTATNALSGPYAPTAPAESNDNTIANTAWVHQHTSNTKLLATFGSNQSGLMVSVSGYIRVYSGVAITLSNSSAYEGQTLTFVGYNCSSGSFTVNGVACNFPQYALKFVFLDGAWHNLI